jgi:hypothetical protein
MQIPSTRYLKLLLLALVLALAAAGLRAAEAPISGPSLMHGELDRFGRHQPIAHASFGERALYFVIYRDAPLATYRGERPGLQRAPMRARGPDGRVRLDARSAEARVYLAFLQTRQGAHLAAIESRIGRQLPVEDSYLRAINASLVHISAGEARAIETLPEVERVVPMQTWRLDTDAGPSLIGAPQVWTGIAAPDGQPATGIGMVVGVLDSGINFDSPSFAAIGPLTGHVHQAPSPGGAHLGTCAPGGIDEGRCNDKLFGAYDFVFEVCSGASNPCGAPGSWADTPSASDNDGHGTHVAATAAGNTVLAALPGAEFTVEISGVAPHAGIVAFDVCYRRVSDGAGLCPAAASVGAVDQAIDDGLVDVISFSIGGGLQPWRDPVSMAFRSATAAGILVSASAGNSGPSAGSLGHLEPWVMSVGAATHGRDTHVFFLDVTRSDAVAAPTAVSSLPGTIGAPLPVDGVDGQIVVSPAFASNQNAAFDGCLESGSSPYSEGQFQDQVVLVRRALCPYTEQAINAEAAGALAVIFANRQDLSIIAAADGTAAVGIPLLAVSQLDGLDLRAAILADAGTTLVAVDGAAAPLPQPPDVMAAFSSRGPSVFDLVKPDLVAPGVGVLSAHVPEAGSAAYLSGTSMAQPHAAGAAALLRGMQPAWSPMEVKSALMLAAASGVLRQDGTTPSSAWDRGAGRVQVSTAAASGLVLDETALGLETADPYAGGELSALNLASLADLHCSGVCTFERTVRAVRGSQVDWSLQVQGLPGSTIDPEVLDSLSAGASRSLTVMVDASQLAPGADHFGELTLTPSDNAIPIVRLPIVVRPGPPVMVLAPQSDLEATVEPGGSHNLDLTISNSGNPTLQWQVAGGQTAYDLLALPEGAGGVRTQYFLSFGTGEYNAEDFEVVVPTRINRLRANGSLLPAFANLGGTQTFSVGRAVSFAIFADAGRRPDGYPEGQPSQAIWEFSLELIAPNVPPGLDLTGNDIDLDLAAAGAPVLDLEPGKYWLLIYPSLLGNGSTGNIDNPVWLWSTSDRLRVGSFPQTNFPFFDGDQWAGINQHGLSSRIVGTVDCGASWMSSNINSGALGFGDSATVSVTLSATGLEPGVHTAVLCISSQGTDPSSPLGVLPVTLNVIHDENAIFGDGFESG